MTQETGTKIRKITSLRQMDVFEKMLESNKNSLRYIRTEHKKRNLDISRGEVWICDFGQNVGGEISGCRPALIIQVDTVNKSRTTIVLPIGKIVYEELDMVPIKEEDIENLFGNLEGYIYINQMKTVSKARLGQKIAVLSPSAMRKIQEAMMNQIFQS